MRATGVASVLALAAILAGAQDAGAQDHPGAEFGIVLSNAEPVTPPAERWYGAGMVGADVGLVSLSFVSRKFLLPYVLGPPVVHLAHERPVRALASLALRGGVVLAAGYAGWIAEVECDEETSHTCGDAAAGGYAAGVVVGALLVVLIDDVLLARREPEADSSHGFQPTVTPIDGGAALGLAGRF